MQRQLSLRTSWEGHQLGCHPGVHTLSFLHLLQSAEVMTASYFRLEEKRSHLSIGPEPMEEAGTTKPDIRVSLFLKILRL